MIDDVSMAFIILGWITAIILLIMDKIETK